MFIKHIQQTSTFRIKKEQNENILSNNINKKEGLKLFPKATSGKAIFHTTRNNNRTALSDVSNMIPLLVSKKEYFYYYYYYLFVFMKMKYITFYIYENVLI